MRKKTRNKIVTGLVSGLALTAMVSLYLVNTEDTSAGMQNYGESNVDVKAGKLEFTMTKLNGVVIENAGDTYDPTGLSEGDLIGNTSGGATNNPDGEMLLSYVQTFTNISPGWQYVYGFKVENTGTLQNNLNLHLGTKYFDPSDDAYNWDEQDPRKKIMFTVYAADSLTGEFTKVASGRLQDDTEVPLSNPVITYSELYDNIQQPGKIPNTSYSLTETGDSIYYIVKLEFEDTEEAWQGNNKGDNVYYLSRFQMSLGVSGVGPTDSKFEFGVDLPEYGTEETSSQQSGETPSQDTEEETSSQQSGETPSQDTEEETSSQQSGETPSQDTEEETSSEQSGENTGV